MSVLTMLLSEMVNMAIATIVYKYVVNLHYTTKLSIYLESILIERSVYLSLERKCVVYSRQLIQ